MELEASFLKNIDKDIHKVYSLTGGGNSQVFKVVDKDGNFSVYKFIPKQELVSELFFFSCIREINIPTLNILKHGTVGSLGYYQMELIESTQEEVDPLKIMAESASQLNKLHTKSTNGFGKVISIENGTLIPQYQTLNEFLISELDRIKQSLSYTNNSIADKAILTLTKDLSLVFRDQTESCVVHGDPAPYNSLVRSNGEIVLIDPGPVRLATREWEYAYLERRYIGTKDKTRIEIRNTFTKSYNDAYPKLNKDHISYFRVLIALGKLVWALEKQPKNLQGPISQFEGSWKLYLN